MAHAVAAFPAGILAAMGLVTLLAGRAWKSDVLSGVLCGAALVLAGGMLGFGELGARDGLTTELPGNQTVVGPEAIAQSSPAATRQFLIEDRLSRSATWLALGLGLLAAATASDGSPRACRRFAILLLSLSGVLLAAIANDIVLAVIAMELASLPATVLLFVERNAPNARAAAVRSLALNIFALGMLVAGAALIALLSGTTNLEDLRHRDSARRGAPTRPDTDGRVSHRGGDWLRLPFGRAGGPFPGGPLSARGCRNLRWREVLGPRADGVVPAGSLRCC